MYIGIRKGIRGRWGLFILLLVFLWPVLALALSASQVFEQVKDSVVVVKALDRQGKQVGLGSGVVLPSGEVATNHHVATAGERLQVGTRGRYVPAFLLASDPERDLALLLAPGLAATPARLGRAGGLKVGDKVFAVGAPYGLELSPLGGDRLPTAGRAAAPHPDHCAHLPGVQRRGPVQRTGGSWWVLPPFT